MEAIVKNEALKSTISVLRSELLLIEKKIRALKGTPLEFDEAADVPELAANITLAFRHCEDARMRLGKAIQALEGGVSLFDKQPLPSVLSPAGSPSAHEGEPYPSPF